MSSLKTVNHHGEGIHISFKLELRTFTQVVQWIEALTLVLTDSMGPGSYQSFRNLIFFPFFTPFFTCVVHMASIYHNVLN